MEARTFRKIKDGRRYDGYFPTVPGINNTLLTSAGLEDTMDLIPRVIDGTRAHTAKIAQVLKGLTLEETCSNIWHFLYDHIRYKKDEAGKEQVRSPARSWRDRFTGIDCDCYTTFVGSILLNLKIPFVMRIAKYSKDYFQHIYPIVHKPGGGYITIDCVTDQYDYEVDYSEIKDYPMQLQFLNGPEDTTPVSGYEDLGNADGVAELGELFYGLNGKKKKKAAAAAASAAPATAGGSSAPPPPKKKKKKLFGKILNVVNKVNPGAILIRNGILLALKMNLFNMAYQLHWAYMSKDEATNATNGVLPEKWEKLVSQRDKLRNHFENAGGKGSNFDKAVKAGAKKKAGKLAKKAAKGKGVSGLFGLEGLGDIVVLDGLGGEIDLSGTSVEELLGAEIYHSENVEGFEGLEGFEGFAGEEGFNQLGEPITLASIGTAMGVLAAIAKNVKSIGNIFGGKKGTQGDIEMDEEGAAAASTTAAPAAETGNNIIDKIAQGTDAVANVLQNDTVQNLVSVGQNLLKKKKKKTAAEPEESNLQPATVKTAPPAINTDAATRAAVLQSASNLPAVVNSAAPAAVADPPAEKKSWFDKNKWYVAGAVAAVGIAGWLIWKNNRPKPKGLSGLQVKRKPARKKPRIIEL